MTYSPDWTALNNDHTFEAVVSPIVPGYVTSVVSIPAKDVTATDSDSTEVVVYRPVGSLIITTPDGKETKTPYPNHPTDPDKVGQPETVVPYVEGTTPIGPDGPLTPINPDRPEEGYEAPRIDPTKPNQDTTVTYVKDDQEGNKKDDGSSDNGRGGNSQPSEKPGDKETQKTDSDSGDGTGNQEQKEDAPSSEESGDSTNKGSQKADSDSERSARHLPNQSTVAMKAHGQTLPNTGQADSSALAMLGISTLLASFGLVAKKNRRKEK